MKALTCAQIGGRDEGRGGGRLEGNLRVKSSNFGGYRIRMMIAPGECEGGGRGGDKYSYIGIGLNTSFCIRTSV